MGIIFCLFCILCFLCSVFYHRPSENGKCSGDFLQSHRDVRVPRTMGFSLLYLALIEASLLVQNEVSQRSMLISLRECFWYKWLKKYVGAFLNACCPWSLTALVRGCRCPYATLLYGLATVQFCVTRQGDQRMPLGAICCLIPRGVILHRASSHGTCAFVSGYDLFSSRHQPYTFSHFKVRIICFYSNYEVINYCFKFTNLSVQEIYV